MVHADHLSEDCLDFDSKARRVGFEIDEGFGLTAGKRVYIAKRIVDGRIYIKIELRGEESGRKIIHWSTSTNEYISIVVVRRIL